MVCSLWRVAPAQGFSLSSAGFSYNMADIPRPSSADMGKRYKAVRQELARLQGDAMAREASLKGEIESLKQELEETRNTAQRLNTHASGLQEELNQLKARNAQLIRSLPSRDVRYTHALKVIMDLLKERLNAIQSLEHFPEFGFTIHFDQLGNSSSGRSSILAFLHRPFFYEHQDRTHLVSWAQGDMHDAYLDILQRRTGKPANGERPVIHVFSSLSPEGVPSKEWWYLSAMKWKVVELPSIWDRMDDQHFDALCYINNHYYNINLNHINQHKRKLQLNFLERSPCGDIHSHSNTGQGNYHLRASARNNVVCGRRLLAYFHNNANFHPRGEESDRFWANKAAVAAVFVIVSLVILGVGALLIVSFLKRRNTARQRLLHTKLFEKYSDSPSPKGSLRRAPDVVYDDSRFTGAKVTSEYPFAGSASNAVASSSAPAAAIAPAPQQQQQYQYQAPPSSSHGSHQTAFYTPNPSQQSLSTHEQHNAAAFSAFSTNPAPLTAVATTQRTHYMLPSQSQAAAVSHYTTTSRSAPPVAYRDPTQADRTSYQHSIDSFYGGGNQR
ncbi:hypothetical protein EST38_g7996 [Candolleomyces aberdarensis]|uniref:Uncharacterized protein n=1 Tax=Candolleomyces aberdarensis TaxID=2316362 RepID=A0A4Q2DDS7_9AGAR|nr:hypothetical protein EST38_g7996 [Candolleomyces aberdarensis]